MNQEQIKFTIDQLRKDKMIYGIESTATNIVCILIIIFSSKYLVGFFTYIIDFGAIIIAVSYTLYMSIGNFKRLSNIKKLEKELK